MKSALTAAALASVAQAGSPIGKVISMIAELQADVLKEGESTQKEYQEFSEWCEDRARTLGHEIKTGKSEVETLTATVAEEEARLGALDAKVEKLTGHIGTAEKDLEDAQAVRSKEHEDFQAEEKELSTTVDMLVRAVAILEREASSGSAALLQASNANAGSLAEALASMVQASQISTSDEAKLTALVQEADDQSGAPAASVYKSHSDGIVDTLQDLQEKAETQLDDVRKKEASDMHNFDMVSQALKDELRFGNDDLAEAKSNIAASSERKSTAAGDLQATQADLKADVGAREALHHDCMAKATSFETETKSRGEELKALAEAKRIIREATGAASLTQVSFAQIASSRSSVSMHGEEVKSEVLHLVRGLAHQHSSTELMQLVSQMSVAMHAQNPFAKVRGLISEMIAKLEEAAEADATKKAYCDKEMSETKTKQGEKSNEIKKLSTRADRMTAQSAQLKEQIAALQKDLANLAGSQAEMDRLRREENTVFTTSKAELDKGVTGIKLALKVLNEYYAREGKAHQEADGAASGIIGLLEVCEADFSKNLATITADEEQAVGDYEKVTKANELEKTTKVKDVKYKVQESKGLDKFSGELRADIKGVQAELDAVNEYMSKIEGECIEKAETYAERKAAHESEIAGLKQGLQILESETAFIQQRTNRHALRGHH